MSFRQIRFGFAIALLLLVSTSCRVEQIDPDGDGIVSASEFFSAAFDFLCGDEGDDPADEEPPADEPPTDEPPADEPPSDEPPGDEPPADEPPADEPPADDEL
jgi:hypothetical protein